MKQIVRGLFLALLCVGTASAESQMAAQAASSMSAQAPASQTSASMDPVVVGPTIYKSLLDNPKARVLVATFAPGAKIGMHSHPDHVGYVLMPGTLNITGSNGKTEVFKLKKGDTIWLDRQTHSAMNAGKTTIKVLIVEIKPMPGM